MNWLDAEESITTSPPRTDPRPVTVSGRCAASVVVDNDAELPQAINERPQWPLPRTRIAIEPDGSSGECAERDGEAGHGSGEPAIDVGRPVQDGGRHGPVLARAVYDDA